MSSEQFEGSFALSPPRQDNADIFAAPPGCSVVAEAMRLIDWGATPVGAMSGWPQPLRTVVRLVLNARNPMCVFWGPALTVFYNDAYSELLGPEQHPAAIARPARLVWADIWHIIGSQIDLVMSGRGATWHENHLVPITRHGHREDVYWTYGYSPIHDDAAPNSVGGVLVVCHETTAHVAASRRQAEHAVSAAAERDRLNQAFAQAPGFMAMLTGPEHRIELANDAFHELIGPREVLGRTVAEALPDAVEQGFVRLLDTVFQRGEAYRSEGVRYAAQAMPGGPVSERFVDFTFQPVRDAAGQVTGIIVDGTDTTERTWAELASRVEDAALLRSEEEFRTLGELQPNLCWMARADGSIYWYNRRWYDYTGLAPQDLLGWGWQAAHHPDHLAEVMARWTESVATGEPLEMTFPLRGADGVFRPFLTRVVPVHNAAGTITRWFGSNVDVTEQQAAAAALRESEARFRVLADSMPQMGWTTTPDGRNDYFNARWYEFTGVPPNATSGDAWVSVFHPDDQPRATQAWRHSVDTGTPFEVEYRLRRHDGVYRWTLGRALPQRDTNDRIIRWFGTCTDIDDTKQAAATLQRSREELERLVERRTAALIQEIEERRKAEEALRQGEKLQAIGQLTGHIAHDFNNILQIVTSGASLLARPGLTDERRTLVLDAMTNAAASARELTGRLLAFARKQALKPEVFDLNDRITGMSELLRHTLGERVSVKTDLDAGLWPAIADVSQLEVAILNLAMNARDAMLPQGGVLTFETRNAVLAATHERAAGDYVCLSVRDSGAGMAPEVLARVFEPFFTTKGLGQGTGLGLAQVHGFSKQSRGDIAVDSTPGVGTTITIHLPRAPAPAVKAAPVPEPAAGPPSPRAAGLTVLVVEDNPAVAGFAASMLEGLGYTTLLAPDAGQAMAMIETGVRIDVVFTDVVMPGEMDGMQLADAILRREPPIAVVLATGYSEKARSWIDGAGAELLSKPYRLDELSAALERALRRRPSDHTVSVR